MRKVYLDYSATTPVKKEVLDAMIPYFTEHYGNPSSIYSIGAESKDAITAARKSIAALIGSRPEEIFFTGCGTEADNWVFFGVSDKLKEKGKHIITSKIEHHAIIHSAEFLEKHGFEVTCLDVDKEGFVDPKELERAIRPDTVLVSVMLVNNEVGTVEPVKELAEIAHKHGVLFHTDAVQALGNVPIDVKEMGIDLMSMSAHKIYGPKGVGALYIRKGVQLSNYIHGGAQELKHRAGTENLAGIVGFGKAAELARLNFDAHVKHASELRDYFADRVLSEIPLTFMNGSREKRHPGNANITFELIEGESILILLDMAGIQISTGSACNSTSLTPSHVLTALGVPYEKIHGSVRFTIGDMTTKEDLDYTIDELKKVVEKLRSITSMTQEAYGSVKTNF